MMEYQHPIKKLQNSKTSLAPDEICLLNYQSSGTSENQHYQSNRASELDGNDPPWRMPKNDGILKPPKLKGHLPPVNIF
jgi:hypothetical protein